MTLVDAWLKEFAWGNVALEGALILALCALAYWLVSWGQRRFGLVPSLDAPSRVLAGVAYPLVLWLMVAALKAYWQTVHDSSNTLALVMPLITCWLLLSLGKKVLLFVFPQSAAMRAVERLFARALCSAAAPAQPERRLADSAAVRRALPAHRE